MFGLYEIRILSHELGSNTYEELVDCDIDKEKLRLRCNRHYKKHPIQTRRGDVVIKIEKGETTSNSWSNDGGGCLARGYIVIKKMPSRNKNE